MKTATKKLILTQKGEVSKSIINMLSNCIFVEQSNKIYTGYYSGTGRFTSAHSAMSTVVSILNAQGYKFTKGNDSVRGGVKGEHVKVSTVAFQFIKSLLK